jgi:hypothetical protein
MSPLPGVYVVRRDQLGEVDFLTKSSGGWFKDRDPTVPVGTLTTRWLDNAHVLYIGKAGAGKSGRRGIEVRLNEYLRFGMGEPIGHWGGRYLWQIAHADELPVYHKVCTDPLGEERRLLGLIHAVYGALPFANLRQG